MSAFIESSCKTIQDTVQSLIGRTPDQPSRHTNNAAPPTDRTPTDSRRSSPATIDLTSPTRTSKQRPRPPITKEYSNEEQRLFRGRYGSPEDATPLPNPASLLSTSSRTSMVKPGAEHSLKPINTLNRNVNHGHGSPPATYGRKSGRPLAFLDEEFQISPFQPPAAKRRRLDTVMNTPGRARDVGYEISVRADAPSTTGPRHTSLTQRPTSSSRYSDGSDKKSLGAIKILSQSEFETTEKINKAARKASRHPAAQSSTVRKSPRQTANGGLSSDPIRIDVDEEPTTKFSGFAQGVDSGASRAAPAQSSETTSRHFPNGKAKMSHSTYPPRGDPVGERRPPPPNSLRNRFRREPQSALNQEEVSDDELAPPRKRTLPLVKDDPKANVAPAQRIRGFPEDGCLLVFARASGVSGFESREPGLKLRRTTKPNSFRIVARAEDETVEEFGFELSNVVQALTDNTSRIRLIGPKKADDAQLRVDIQFEKPADLLLFQTVVGKSITESMLFGKTVTDMTVFFSKPLPKLRPTSSPSKLNNDAESKDAPKTRPQGLIDKLTASSSNTRSRTEQTSGGPKTESGGTYSTERLVRSRRTNQPNYKELEVESVKETERYSEIYGLGPPWEQQLTYGTGRRRATVDFADLSRLDEGEFLNDQLIDFYSLYLFDQKKDLSNKVYIFNTHFFSTLTRKPSGQKGLINYPAVARWTSKEDLFGYDYIVVPINQDAHWYLAIICNVSNISRKPATGDVEDPAKIETHVERAPTSDLTSGPVDSTETNTLRSSPALLSEEPRLTSENLGDELPPRGQEESKLDLVDGHADNSEPDRKAGHDVGSDSPDVETAKMERLQLDSSSSTGILPSIAPTFTAAAKKTKRKPGPPVKKFDLDEPVIIVLDSLAGGARTQAVRALKDYLIEEGSEKRGIEAAILQKACYAKPGQIPLQDNFHDCGVYLLGYMQKFLEDPDRFKNRLLGGEMQTDTDWPEMAMPEMRANMRGLLQDMYKTQHEARQRVKAEKRAKKLATSKAANPPTKDKDMAKTPIEGATPDPKPAQVEKEIPEVPAKVPAADMVDAPAATSPLDDKDSTIVVEPAIRSSTDRLGSPFRPTPFTKRPGSTRASSPDSEVRVMKVDDSPPPQQPSEDDDDKQRSWLERQDNPPQAANVPPRRSPSVVIPSPKRRRGPVGKEADGISHTTKIRSPKRAKTESYIQSDLTHDRELVRQMASEEDVMETSRPASGTFVPSSKASSPAKNSTKSSPAQGAKIDSHGSSHNPISVEDSQDVIVVSAISRKRENRASSTERDSSQKSRTQSKSPAIKRDVPRDARTQSRSPATGPHRQAPAMDVPATTDDDFFVIRSPERRPRATNEHSGRRTPDDTIRVRGDTILETPPDDTFDLDED